MKAVDTNILVYAHREDSPFHTQAWKVLEGLAGSRSAWAIPWPCLHEFVAIVTHPRIYRLPTAPRVALEAVEAWLESPHLVLLAEGPGYFETLRELVEDGKVSGPRVHDARVASLCLAGGVSELWSADRDFSRFANLKVRNPLIA